MGETFSLVDNIYDPTYKIFRACAQLNLRLGLELAESTVLPLHMENYAQVMDDGMNRLESSGTLSKIRSLGIETQYLNSSVFAFREVAKNFDTVASQVALKNPDMVRRINDQIRGFERNFLLAEGLPDRVQYRHVIVAPSLFDAYGGSAFPGVGDLLYKIEEQDPASSSHSRLVKLLRKHVSDLMIVVQRAPRPLGLGSAL